VDWRQSNQLGQCWDVSKQLAFPRCLRYSFRRLWHSRFLRKPLRRSLCLVLPTWSFLPIHESSQQYSERFICSNYKFCQSWTLATVRKNLESHQSLNRPKICTNALPIHCFLSSPLRGTTHYETCVDGVPIGQQHFYIRKSVHVWRQYASFSEDWTPSSTIRSYEWYLQLVCLLTTSCWLVFLQH